MTFDDIRRHSMTFDDIRGHSTNFAHMVVDGGVGPLTPSLMVKVKAAGTITVAAGGVVEASNMLLEGGSLTVNGNIKADGLGYQPGKITCGMLR